MAGALHEAAVLGHGHLAQASTPASCRAPATRRRAVAAAVAVVEARRWTIRSASSLARTPWITAAGRASLADRSRMGKRGPRNRWTQISLGQRVGPGQVPQRAGPRRTRREDVQCAQLSGRTQPVGLLTRPELGVVLGHVRRGRGAAHRRTAAEGSRLRTKGPSHATTTPAWRRPTAVGAPAPRRPRLPAVASPRSDRVLSR